MRDSGGRVVAAVNVSAHASRASKDAVRRELLPPLLDTARRIEADLRRRLATPSARLIAEPIMELMAEWSEHALERLSAAGYRRGGARQVVIELLDEQACALSALDIEDAAARP